MKLLKKLFIPICLAFTMAIGISACGGSGSDDSSNDSSIVESSSTAPITYSLNLRTDKPSAKRGETVTLAAYKVSSEGDETLLNNAVFSIVEGEEFAALSGNTITISQTAEANSVIKVKAKVGATDSNIVEIKVSVPLESITVSQTVENIKSGNSVVLTKTFAPEGADVSGFAWVATEGASLCDINGDVLVVKEGVPTGSVIKVKAVCGEIESETELSFIVGYPIESIEITKPTVSNILNNGFVVLNAKALPENTTNGELSWVITADDESYYSLNGNVLTVSATAPTGAIIKVKAVAVADETIVSEELSFTVGIPLETLNINVSGSTNIPNGKFVTLSVDKYPENATNGDYKWEFVEGEGYCVFDETTGKLTVNEDAPLQAKIVLKVVGTVATSVEDTVEFTVDKPFESLNISSEFVAPYILTQGESYDISLTTTPEDASTATVRWVISEPTWANVVDGKLVISETAPHGKTFTVQAVSGSIGSETLTFQVGIGLTALTVNVDGAEEDETLCLNPGAYKMLSITRTPDNTTDTAYTWVVAKEDEDFAVIANDTLYIDVNAPIGETVSFYAVNGTVQSEPIEVIIGTPITNISISADKTEIVKGESATLSAVITPSNANFPYTWVVTADDESYYSLDGNVLTVTKSAATGAIITVKAVSGSVESENEVSFTVLATEEELNEEKFFFMVPDQITVDKNDVASVLEVELYNFNYEQITDREIAFKVISGAEYLEFTQNGMSATFTAKGHGSAEIEVSLVGKDVKETVSVDVIVPPSSLSIPEVFNERTDIQYAFSMYNHNVAGAIDGKAALPFVATADIVGANTKPCTDIKYIFTHESGETGDAVATYADGKITFHKTGIITVTASSNSGSILETTTEYTFNINDGFNVYNFESAAALLDQKYYTGQVVNFVALEKPVGNYDDPTDPTYGYTYGYDFVPSIALQKHSDQAFLDVINADKTRIIAVNKSVHINGNNHVLDASQLRVLTQSEIDAGNQKYGKSYANHGGLISAEPWTREGHKVNDVEGQFYVNMYNLTVKGPVSIHYENKAKPGTFVGSYIAGLSVGTYEYSAKYSVDIDNVTTSGFRYGFKAASIYEGSLRNSYAYNCYQNGYTFKASIMTVENLKLGPCGAVGIELTPEDSDKAGLNNNQKQTITFKGTIDAIGNYITLDTSYLNSYQPLPGASVDMLVNASFSLNGLTKNQEAHLRELVDISEKQDGSAVVSKICMVTFMFMGTVANSSQAVYEGTEGGIVDATALPTQDGVYNTTAQFIRLTVYAGQGMPSGSVLVYNLKYNPTASAEA